MILSIRHRILIPFLFITVFMTFSAMLISFELINNYYNHQLEIKSQNAIMPVQNLFHQIVSKTMLEFSSDAENISFDDVVLNANKDHQFGITIFNNQFFVYDASSPSLRLVPFNFLNPSFPTILKGIYIKNDGKLFNVQNLATSVNKDMSQPFYDIKENNQQYRLYVYEHDKIKQLFFEIEINSTLIEQKRLRTLGIVMIGLLLVNLFIIIIFSIILKHITKSLSEMTQIAKQLSKGQIISPMKVKSNDEFGLLAQSFNNMLNSVHTKTAELIYEKNRSKNIIAQLPDGIIVTDLNHKLVMANRAAETMLGFSTDCAKGHELIRYLKDENLYSLFSNHLTTVDSTSLIREISIPNTKGVEQSYQITISPLLDSTYQKTGLITVIRNITQENQARLLKDNFLRSVTHELRTPLTSIIGFLNILKKELHGNLNDKQKEFLTISLLNSSLLKKLINNLLDLSIIHSGQLTLEKETFCLNDQIQELIHESLPMIERKQNYIMVDFQDENMLIHADKQKFFQMIQNLILNANKYTNEGKIECVISQTSSFTSIVIKDDGTGLSKEQKQTLYKAFKTNNAHEFTFCESIGIELTIVKELIKLHDGEIHLESEYEKGSSFTIILPQEKTCFNFIRAKNPIM